MAYKEHPIEHVDVSDLHLDVSNYRFATDQPSEAAAMNYLWASQDVDAVASLILRDGYVDNELPLVVEEDGKLILLEGNRRMSALLALLNPSIAPAHQAEIERLLRRFAVEAENLPHSIRVMVLPDRASAAPILARLHIGQNKRRWDVDEQAKFVLAQLTDGVTLAQLINELPGIKNVPRVARMGRVREALTSTTFTDPAVAAFAMSSKLKMTSFEYAYRQTAIQELIGLGFDQEAHLVSWATTPERLHALEVLLRGFQANELNTRRGLDPKEESYGKLLARMAGTETPAPAPAAEDAIPEEAPDEAGMPGTADPERAPAPAGSSASGSSASATPTPGTATTGTGDGASGSQAEGSGGSNATTSLRGPINPDLKTKIDLMGINQDVQPVPMKHRLKELREIHVPTFPASTVMLMRSVLEAAIKEHFGGSNGITVTGTLSDVMKPVEAAYKKNGQLAGAINTIQRYGRDQTTAPGTGAWFNSISHSVQTPVTGVEVQRAWRIILPLVRFLLNEPQRSA